LAYLYQNPPCCFIGLAVQRYSQGRLPDRLKSNIGSFPMSDEDRLVADFRGTPLKVGATRWRAVELKS
jgi:hypothetical protein